MLQMAAEVNGKVMIGSSLGIITHKLFLFHSN